MHSTVAHHPGADGPSDPEQQPPASFPLVYVLSLTPYGMEYPSGQLGPAVPVLPIPASCVLTGGAAHREQKVFKLL